MAPAMAPAMSAATAMVMRSGFSSGIHPLTPGRMSTVNPRQQAGDKKEDAVHDAKGKARFQHRACLVDVNSKSVEVGGTDGAQVDEVRVAAVDRGAVHRADPAQVKDGGDKSADKGEVDEGDELRVGGGAVVGE